MHEICHESRQFETSPVTHPDVRYPIGIEGATTKTNAALDTLIEQARHLGHHQTGEQAVTAALNEYIRHRKQLEILDHFGTIDYDPTCDYKKMRQLVRIELDQ